MGSRWRERYKVKVHPVADVFPMMSDAELAELGANIKANGLRERIRFWRDNQLVDGRNRMAAMHFAGIEVQAEHKQYLNYLADPVAYTISANIHRRHLNKHEKADLIVRAVKAGEKLAQVEPVSAGGRGKVNKVKAKAVAEAEKVGISEATVKRALAKAEGKQPKPKPKPKVKSKYWGEDTDDEQGEGCNFDPTLPDNDAEDMAACRRRSSLWRAETAKEYAENQAGLNGMDSADPSEIDMEIVNAAAAAGAAWVTLAAALREKQASTLPQDGRPSSDRDKGR